MDFSKIWDWDWDRFLKTSDWDWDGFFQNLGLGFFKNVRLGLGSIFRKSRIGIGIGVDFLKISD